MWTCPKCKTQVDPGFDLCWRCGTTAEGVEDPTFQTADQAGPIEDRQYDPIAEPARVRWAEAVGGSDDELVTCYQAFSLMEAKFIADQLNGNGIPAMSDTIDMQDALGTMDGNPRIYCRESDLPKAHAWLKLYETNKQSEIGRRLEP